MVSTSRIRAVRYLGIAAALVTVFLGAVTAAPAQAQLVETESWGGPWHVKPYAPTAVDFSDSGELVLADSGYGRIVRLTPGGDVDDTWSTGETGSTYPRTENPADVAVDGDGNVYVVDQITKQVKKYSPDGTLLDTWDLTGEQIYGIEYDDSGSLFVLHDETVQRLTTGGVEIASWGGFTSDKSDPLIATDDDGHVLVAGTTLSAQDESFKDIWRFDLDGNELSKWESKADNYREIPYTKCAPATPGAIEKIFGYMGLAARDGGGAWVVPYSSDSENLIVGLSPDGDTEIGFGNRTDPHGPLAIDPDGHFWVAPDNQYTYNAGNWLREYDVDGTPLRTIERTDLPKYLDERGEGLMSDIEDLGVSPGGSVDAYERFNARTQRFGATGTFDWLADGPFGARLIGFDVGTHHLLYGAGDGVRLLDTAYKTLYTYSDDGTETGKVSLAVPGAGIFGGVDAGGGQTFIVSGPPLRVSLMGVAGNEISTWSPQSLPEPSWVRATVKARRTPGGNLLLLSDQTIQEYTVNGSPVREWAVPGEAGTAIDLAVDGNGIVYVLASDEAGSSLLTYWPNGQLFSNERIGPQSVSDAIGQIAVTPGGVIYGSSNNQIHRFEELPGGGAAVQAQGLSLQGLSKKAGLAAPVEPRGGYCDGNYDDPDPDPGPKPDNRFRVNSVSYSKKRKSAKLGLSLPFAGKVVLYGNKKVRRRSFTVARPGRFTIKVKAKAKWRRPVHRRSRVKVPLTARLRYIPVQGRRIQYANRKLVLKRKLLNRRGGASHRSGR